MLQNNAWRLIGAPLAAMIAWGAMPAHANVTLGGTRVILAERDREASIPVKNNGLASYVIQAWMDAGEGQNKTPFTVTPPLSRLDPGKENILRILRVSAELPGDRESVFWLNVKEIPEKSNQENVLQIAIRTRIKLFYRPSALPGSPAESRTRLRWAVIDNPHGPGAALKIVNPTPYHVTFTALSINRGQQEINADMAPPLGESIYPLSTIATPQDIDVSFTTINDYGGETPEEMLRVPASTEPVAVTPQSVAVPR